MFARVFIVWHLIYFLKTHMDRSSLIVFKGQVETIVQSCLTNKLSICARCILRYCNAKQVFTQCTQQEMVNDLAFLLGPVDSVQLNEVVNAFCRSCLNLLSDTFAEEKSKQVEEDLAQNGFTVNEHFQLVIHLPVVITLRNNYYLKKFLLEETEIMSIKEVLKVLIATRLSRSLNVKHKTDSNINIELTFTHINGDKECEQLVDIAPEIFYVKKCRKSSVESFINHSSILRVINQLDEDALDHLKMIDIREPCSLSRIDFNQDPIYIAGRYLKFSRVLSQTPWIVNGNTLFMSSVQEKLTSGVQKFIACKDIKFCASGREDVDVRMLGRGRPFLLEILNPRLLTNDDLIGKIKSSINESNTDVQVLDLQFVEKVDSQKFLKEGEENKTKTYQALCCLSRPYTNDDFQLINSTKNVKIKQKTPIRVLHRRTLSDRTRTIHQLWTETVDKNELDEQYIPYLDRIFKLNLVTEAGTYIKEFVHSDFGRTTPNLCSLLGNCSADIITLDVMEVNMDWPKRID